MPRLASGREIARQLAPLAGTLVLVARRTDRLETLRAELLRVNPDLRVDIRTVDLSVPAEVDALCDHLRDNAPELDFLINNAGFGDSGPFETSDRAKIERMLQVNVVALTSLCHQLVPTLRRHRPGAILNVSSIASLMPLPNLAVYAATKAYVSSFSEGLRAELRRHGHLGDAPLPRPGGHGIPDHRRARRRAGAQARAGFRQGAGGGSGPCGATGGDARPGAGDPRVLDVDGPVFLRAGAVAGVAVVL